MNTLLKNRYFRREFLIETWFLIQVVDYDIKWHHIYGKNVNYEGKITKDNTINKDRVILKASFKGYLWILQKLKNNIRKYERTMYMCLVAGHLHIVKYIIENICFDINKKIAVRDNGVNKRIYYYNALEISVKCGNLQIVKYLIEHGANVYTSDHLLFLCSGPFGIKIKKNFEVFKYLVENFQMDINKGGDHALYGSATDGHLEIVQYLVEHGVDVNAWHNMALSTSFNKGYKDIAQYLFEHGACWDELLFRNLE